MADCVQALKQWTVKSSATIIYDSTVDEFTDDGLFEKVKGKENIAIIGFTTDGDVFGGFYSVVVTRQEEWIYDPNIFAFSFESHGRCMTPQRFVVKDGLKGKANLRFYKNCSYGFVKFYVDDVDARFFLGNESSNSFCRDMSKGFEGIQDTTLTGQSGDGWNPPYHHCTRLVAIQLS